MLGRTIADPDGVEGPAANVVGGLGLLDVDDGAGRDKTTVAVAGRHVASGEPVSRATRSTSGRTAGADCARPLLDLDGRPDGAQSADGSGRRHLRPRSFRRRRFPPRVPDVRSARRHRRFATRRPSKRRSTRSPITWKRTSTSTRCSPSPATAQAPRRRPARQTARQDRPGAGIDPQRPSDVRRLRIASPGGVDERVVHDRAAVAARAGQREAERAGHRRLRPAGVRRAVVTRVARSSSRNAWHGRAAGERRGERDQRAGEAARRQVDEIVETRGRPAEVGVALASGGRSSSRRC